MALPGRGGMAHMMSTLECWRGALESWQSCSADISNVQIERGREGYHNAMTAGQRELPILHLV